MCMQLWITHAYLSQQNRKLYNKELLLLLLIKGIIVMKINKVSIKTGGKAKSGQLDYKKITFRTKRILILYKEGMHV